MKKIIAWLLLAGMLGFGGYRIWDRNTQPPAPVVIEQVQPAPTPPTVQVPAPAAKPAPRKPHAEPARPPEPPKGGKAKPRPRTAPAPAATPARPVPDVKYPRGADNGASTLPVSCATVRWYVENTPALGKALAAKYNPTAGQIAAAEACLKKK